MTKKVSRKPVEWIKKSSQGPQDILIKGQIKKVGLKFEDINPPQLQMFLSCTLEQLKDSCQRTSLGGSALKTYK